MDGSDSNEILPFFHGVEEEEDIERNGDLSSKEMLLPSLPEKPETPKQPLEFLSRSWSVSASEISKVLAQKNKPCYQLRGTEQLHLSIPETKLPSTEHKTMINPINTRKPGSITRWFLHKDTNSTNAKKDRARAHSARVYSAVSVAALAVALASVTASSASESKIAAAVASAAELLASHCIEAAEAAGVDHDHLISTVTSAVEVSRPSDVATLTAAAATALRGEAALRARLPKEVRKNSVITPYEKSFAEAPSSLSLSLKESDDQSNSSGDDALMQKSEDGVLKAKRVSVHVNKRSEVIIKMKSRHVGRAFTRSDKCVVYDVCEDDSDWPCRKETETPEDQYFGLKTAKGLIEFKCKGSAQKQRWVSWIQKLLLQARMDQKLDPTPTGSSRIKIGSVICD